MREYKKLVGVKEFVNEKDGVICLKIENLYKFLINNKEFEDQLLSFEKFIEICNEVFEKFATKSIVNGSESKTIKSFSFDSTTFCMFDNSKFIHCWTLSTSRRYSE